MPYQIANITGQRFGRLLVTEQHEPRGKYMYWLCKCDCGQEHWVRSRSLREGLTRSCGCLTRMKDLNGQKIHKLTVIERDNSKPIGQVWWRVRCECGTEKTVSANNLKYGNCQSCGCIRKEAARQRSRKLWAHYKGEASRKRVFKTYQRHAARKGLIFDLSPETFYALVAQPCVYCGAEGSNVSRSQNDSGDFVYTGIDRMDNDSGYISSNVVPCCAHCNRAKLKMSSGDFRQWVVTVYNHWAKHIG